MRLVIVEGISGVGKSTVAHCLSKELNCAVFSKDSYKEELFDQLGKKPSVRQWTHIDKQSWQILYSKITELLDTDVTLIVDGDFKRKHIVKIAALMRNDTKVVEVYCFAHGLVPLKRYIRRSRSEGRHRGHRDPLWYFMILAAIILDRLGIKISGPFELKGAAIRVDTTNFDRIRYEEILQHIRR